MMTKPKPNFSTIFIFLILSLSSSPQIHSATFPGDIAALRALKSAVKPSSIPATSCLATWNFAAADPCAVLKVTYFTCGITCSAGRVVQITLDSQGYAGTLTPLISKLTQLINLDLGENRFYGQIPSSISYLPNLQNLILGSNSFNGSVPQSISNLRSLETLDISKNSLSGSIPNLHKLASLTRLDLSYNKLTGSIPRLPPNLHELALRGNSLSGLLTQSVFSGLTQLMVVELSENSLDGKLEPWFFLLPSLQQVDLSNNSFNLVSVTKSPSSELVAVDLSYNKIEGYLPVGFSGYPVLRSLSLSYNRFRGPIPREYRKNRSPLRRLYLDGNFLNGSPPEGFFSDKDPVLGSLGDNCLQRCPKTSNLCSESQKSASICQQAYGGKPKY
ncbi:hypothetical protein CASFOL_036042 [Castilleja foliolosa]|uniref:Uncharacterized protein n=1 Tax=Castilleja foliolosa TaxID=1961234 RepID=A0ABD3BWR4_9LAMI